VDGVDADEVAGQGVDLRQALHDLGLAEVAQVEQHVLLGGTGAASLVDLGLLRA
jgi:hypothetical protein